MPPLAPNASKSGSFIYILLVVTDETSGIMDQAASVVVSESETWTPRPDWTGPPAALYRSFDISHGLVLMEISQEINQLNLVSGKVMES